MKSEIEQLVFVSSNPQNIILSRDGKIRAKDASKQIIGTWEHTHTNKEKNFYKHQRGYKMVSDLYCGGIPYRGSTTAYSRKEFIEDICGMIRRHPIVINNGNVLV